MIISNKRRPSIMDTDTILKTARDLGADFVGIADLTPARDYLLREYNAFVAQFPRGIALGIGLMHSIVDRLPDAPHDPVITKLYWHSAYEIVNARLDRMANRLAGILQSAGYQGAPIPATVKVDNDELRGPFTHKLTAHLAGLGWIGKNCMLITPQAGPRVRWATVLTDMPLTPTGHAMSERCGACDTCVRICPVSAFSGRAFSADEPLDARYNARACQAHLRTATICGLCLYACPYGRTSTITKLEQQS
jgi:epoxyqueuosine reductase QueG